jgi:hypothetical protein
MINDANVIKRIRERLMHYPTVTYRDRGNAITINPMTTDGFSVSLAIERAEFVVSFDGWHEHFQSEDDALNCCAFGLSDRCRLRVLRRWGIEYRWTLETQTDAGWREDSTTGLLLFPFWGKLEIIYRRNALLREIE